MKRKLISISALLLCSIFALTPVADAQVRRGNSDQTRNHSTIRPRRGGNNNSNIRPGRGDGFRNNDNKQRPSRPDNSFRPGNNGNNNRPTNPGNNNNFRPGNNNGNNNRPNHPGNNNNFRPDNNNGNNHRPNNPGNNNNFRPGNNNGNNHRPQYPGNNHFRPGNNHRPNHPEPIYRPTPSRPLRPGYGYRPGPNRPAYMRPPMRPGRPTMRPWVRPVPPPHWRPSYTGSLIGNILGLTFGVAIGSALDNLYYSGYSIDGYMDNQVYLTGVNQFNSYWPDATLYFGNGGLIRSQFFNPSFGYDTNRFYSVYSTLCGMYGVPAINNMTGAALSATWFGRGGDYITLQYSPMVSGNYNYFTILTIGR